MNKLYSIINAENILDILKDNIYLKPYLIEGINLKPFFLIIKILMNL